MRFIPKLSTHSKAQSCIYIIHAMKAGQTIWMKNARITDYGFWPWKQNKPDEWKIQELVMDFEECPTNGFTAMEEKVQKSTAQAIHTILLDFYTSTVEPWFRRLLVSWQ